MKHLILLSIALGVYASSAHAAFPTVNPPSISAFTNQAGPATYTDDHGNILPIAVFAQPGIDGSLGLPADSVTKSHFSQVTGLPDAPIYTDTGGHKMPIYAMFGLSAGALVPFGSSFSFDSDIDAHGFGLFNFDALIGPDPVTGPSGYQGPQVSLPATALIDANGAASMDWTNRIMGDSSQLLSLTWQDRLLVNSNGNVSLNWQQDKLADENGKLAFQWSGSNRLLLNENERPVVNYSTTQLIDFNGFVSLGWDGRALNDELGNGALGWSSSSRYLLDANENLTVDWNNRQFRDGSVPLGPIVGDWGPTGFGVSAIEIKEGHVKSTQSIPPSAAPTVNAGLGATCAVTQATDTAGLITLVMGTGTGGVGDYCDVTFHSAYAVAPICSLTATNQFALSSTWVATSTTQLSLFFGSGSDTTTFSWFYNCIETQ